MRPPTCEEPSAVGAGLRNDLAWKLDQSSLNAAAEDSQAVVRLVLRHLKFNRYAVEVEGEILVENSSDPEHQATRARLTRGITGTAVTFDAVAGKLRMRFSISKFARTYIIEDDRGLRVAKWTPPPSNKGLAQVNARSASAFFGPADTGEPVNQENDVAEAA